MDKGQSPNEIILEPLVALDAQHAEEEHDSLTYWHHSESAKAA